MDGRSSTWWGSGASARVDAGPFRHEASAAILGDMIPSAPFPIRRRLTTGLAIAVLPVLFLACAPEMLPMDAAATKAFATRYAAAWCSQKAASVAAHFAAQGSLTINAGTPAVGRAAITASAQGFMSAFPDMVVSMGDDGLIASSLGHFDDVEYQRQLKQGVAARSP